MNAKKAKAARRAAEAATIGESMAEYEGGTPPVYQEIADPLTGVVIGHKKVRDGVPLRLAKGCTRHLYKFLKKGEVNV